IARCVRWRVVRVECVTCEEWRHALHTGADLAEFGLRLGDVNVHALSIFDVEVARPAVAGPDEGQAVPIEAIARCTVLGMRPLPVDHAHAVLVIDDPAIVAEVVLVDFDVVALADREDAKGVVMPREHLLHAVDHRGGAVLWRAPGRAIYLQLLVPPPSPS